MPETTTSAPKGAPAGAVRLHTGQGSSRPAAQAARAPQGATPGLAAPAAAGPATPVPALKRLQATAEGPRREQMGKLEDQAGSQLDAARDFAAQARAARIAAQRNEDFLGDCMTSLGHCASECWHCGCLDPCCPAEWGSRGRDCPPALKWCICGVVTSLVVGVTVGTLT